MAGRETTNIFKCRSKTELMKKNQRPKNVNVQCCNIRFTRVTPPMLSLLWSDRFASRENSHLVLDSVVAPINRTNALASTCADSKNRLSLAQIEIPSGLASSHAANATTGLEPISGSSTDHESTNCSTAPALLNVCDYKGLRCSLQVYCQALPMHHAGFSHHAQIQLY